MMRETETEKENSVTKASQGGMSGETFKVGWRQICGVRANLLSARSRSYIRWIRSSNARVSAKFLLSGKRPSSGKRATRTIYTKEKFLTLKYFQSICTMTEAWRADTPSFDERTLILNSRGSWRAADLHPYHVANAHKNLADSSLQINVPIRDIVMIDRNKMKKRDMIARSIERERERETNWANTRIGNVCGSFWHG